MMQLETFYAVDSVDLLVEWLWKWRVVVLYERERAQAFNFRSLVDEGE
jgi:hypothetical protein